MRHDTIHVAVDGSVTYGLPVPRMLNRKGKARYVVAAARRHTRGNRFIPAGVPRGVDLNVMLPHDCKQHWADSPPVAAFSDHAGVVFTDADRVALGGDE